MVGRASSKPQGASALCDPSAQQTALCGSGFCKTLATQDSRVTGSRGGGGQAEATDAEEAGRTGRGRLLAGCAHGKLVAGLPSSGRLAWVHPLTLAGLSLAGGPQARPLRLSGSPGARPGARLPTFQPPSALLDSQVSGPGEKWNFCLKAEVGTEPPDRLAWPPPASHLCGEPAPPLQGGVSSPLSLPPPPAGALPPYRHPTVPHLLRFVNPNARLFKGLQRPHSPAGAAAEGRTARSIPRGGPRAARP